MTLELCLKRAAALSLAVPLALVLSGCASLMTSKKAVPVPMAPELVKTASADELADQVNADWAKFESLTATVDIRASRLKSKEGVETDYPSFRSYILVRKPQMLRMQGKLPIVQTAMFDLASDGTNFTMVVPPRNKVYEGLSAVEGKSPNWYENLRPGFLINSVVVQGLQKDELYSVITETVTVADTAKKKLILRPDYVLNIVRRKTDSQELYPVRVIRFHRDDLLPYQQDLYDNGGNLQTQIIYGPYKQFDTRKFPSTITLKRPQDGYQLVMTVERVAFNPSLTDDMFHVKIPPTATIQKLN